MVNKKDFKVVSDIFKRNRDQGIKGTLIVPPDRAFDAARFVKDQDNLEYKINWLGDAEDNIGYIE